MSDKILDAIRRLSDKQIRYVINTHAHPDHIGGNVKIAQAGQTIAGGNLLNTIADAASGAVVIAHESVLTSMSSAEETPFDALPTDVYIGDRKDLFFNGEPIVITHQPSAHTDEDSIVFFRGSDVISVGDVYITTGYPIFRPEDGGTVQGSLAALNRIIETAVPEQRAEGGTMIIPGHGRLSDEADVVEIRDMLTIIRGRIQSMIDLGMSLRQVKAARPASDYDPRYGSDSGFWTTEQFVETIYKNLRSKGQ